MKLWFDIDCFWFLFVASMFRWNLDAVERLNEIVQEQTHMNYVVFGVDMSNAKGNSKPETSHYKKRC